MMAEAALLRPPHSCFEQQRKACLSVDHKGTGCQTLRPSQMGGLEWGWVSLCLLGSPRTWAQQQDLGSAAEAFIPGLERTDQGQVKEAGTACTCLLLISPRASTLELLSPGYLRWRSDGSQHPILYICCTVPLSQSEK